MHASTLVIAISVAAGLVISMLGSVFVGRRFGLWRSREDHANDPHIGVVQGAILGLLGLLLGFSFSGASSRFIERQDLLVREAGAIETVYQRCDLVPPHVAEPLRVAIRQYAAARLELFEAAPLSADARLAATAKAQAAVGHVWDRTVIAVASQPSATSALVTAASEVGDLLALRNASTRKHSPLLVVIVMIACAFASLGSVGYVLGLSSPPRPVRGPVVMLTLLISATLWTIIDLDFARHGLIQIDNRALAEVNMLVNAPRTGASSPASANPGGSSPH